MSPATLWRALHNADLTRKRIKKKASERNNELRTAWMGRLMEWTANQLICIDESAANKHTKDRKWGWSKRGVDPVVYRPAKRSERWSILPAYTIEGVLTYEIIQGGYSQELYDAFIINKVLPLCTPYPGPRSVLIMDNASCHKSMVSQYS